MKRVVVTGIGLLTSIGNNKEDTWNNLLNLKSGVKKISHFDTEGLTCKIAGHIPHDKKEPFHYDNSIHLDLKDIKRNDRFIQYGIAAAKMAVIEFVDRDIEAKKVDRKKKETSKDKNEEKKLATS